MRNYDKKLILECGEEFCGYSFGDDKSKVLELVFNTSMTGYQEIMSDPSYTDQAVVMTYPLIGNYGMADGDYETETPSVGALVVHDYNDEPSHYNSKGTLSDVMKKYGISGIYGIDTRKLTRIIRDNGTGRAMICDVSVKLSDGVNILRLTDMPHDAVSRVSCKSTAAFGVDPLPYRVAVIDCGVKKSMIHALIKRGCKVFVMPWDSTAENILSLKPDGVLVSNGPGDPADVPQTASCVRALLGKLPVFGICLGHQILSIAYGAKTYKLKFGHRGGNHPVKNIATGKIEITSQNHSFAVDDGSIEKTPLEITHINLLDRTVEGVCCKADRAFGVQYHPESSPGPQDSFYLFDSFIKLMEEHRAEKN